MTQSPTSSMIPPHLPGTDPLPPHSLWRRWLGVVAIIALGALIVITGWLGYVIVVPVHIVPLDQTTSVATLSVPAGSSVTSIAQLAKQAGAIRSTFALKVYLYITNQRSGLKAGDYTLPARINMPQLVDLLETGVGSRAEVQVTIPEGYTSDQIQATLEAAGLAVANFDITVAAGVLPVSDMTLSDGRPARATLEGYLYPDTYRFFSDATVADVVAAMTNRWKDQLTPELRAQIDQSDLSFFEILTLASIIEKEVSLPSDRALVAGVFLNRLEIGMALQSDATVHFITGTAIDELTSDDLATVSPYNTYLYPGLPAGPISNPGLDAIMAVLNPTPSDYYYFLAAPDGTTIYSKTLEEHEANVDKYLR